MLLTKLPPLPRNKALEQACGFEALHYKEVLAYGQQCREAALEEAEKAVESYSQTLMYTSTGNAKLSGAEGVRS